MAKAPTQVVKPLAEQSEEVTEWIRLTLLLIDAAGGYAMAGVEDPEMSGTIRQLKVLTSAMNGALQSIR